MIKRILICLSFAFFLPLPAAAYADEIAIISNSAFPRSSLTTAQVKDIYLGKIEILDGVKIKPIDQKSALKKDFLSKILQLNDENYKSHWIKRVFREGGAPPAVKVSTDDVLSAVNEDKCAIGYISADEAKGKSGIKVLFTTN